MLPDTGIDDVKKQKNAEYAKHINDPVLSSLKMEGIRLLFTYLTILTKGFPGDSITPSPFYTYIVHRSTAFRRVLNELCGPNVG
jgi:hypothetical protein